MRSIRQAAFVLLALAGTAHAQPASRPLPVLDVPFISQSEALCGGAAAAMVLRYWGERGLTAESFAPLLDRSAAGIRTTTLVADLQRRGWMARGIEGTEAILRRELADGRPVLTLIADRPGTFHYIVVVAAADHAIVFHDPARAPYRVMSLAEFSRRWDTADRWMAIILPPSTPVATASADAPVPVTSCDQLVAEGVQQAQQNDLAAAERSLTAALSCPGASALRELAGVRLLQRRWPDVASLAEAALAQEPGNAYALRLLGTSRFVQNDPIGALEAWNAAGEPRVDLVVVDGLSRTRTRVAEQLTGFEAGDVVTPPALLRAQRRLDLLPAAAMTRVEYVPVPSGLAEIRAAVVERDLIPTGWWSYAALGAVAAVSRQVELDLASPSGGGELYSLAWRFWPTRPRVAVGVLAPAPWGGVWGVEASGERQPFDRLVPPTERRSIRAVASQWMLPTVELSARAGMERWDGAGAFGYSAAEVRALSPANRLDARVGVELWAGADRFAAISGRLAWRTSTARSGLVYTVDAGGGLVTRSAPMDLWLAGDTGHARSILLRAHPLLDDGALRVTRLGRRVAHATAEAERWWRGPAASAAAAAVFVDVVHLDQRLAASSRGDVDVGLGLRLALPGVRGTFRVDVAKGLRDGATALSVGYRR